MHFLEQIPKLLLYVHEMHGIVQLITCDSCNCNSLIYTALAQVIAFIQWGVSSSMHDCIIINNNYRMAGNLAGIYFGRLLKFLYIWWNLLWRFGKACAIMIFTTKWLSRLLIDAYSTLLYVPHLCGVHF